MRCSTRWKRSPCNPPRPATCAASEAALLSIGQTAASSVSPVRMRTTCSTAVTKILPSPILPVLAALTTASMQRSTSLSLTTTSIFTFGRKSTTYSAPRYSSVCPFCRPKPLTSVTVNPDTPTSASASRTSSSLNGLMIAVICFMASSGVGDARRSHLSTEPRRDGVAPVASERPVGDANTDRRLPPLVLIHLDEARHALHVGAREARGDDLLDAL